MPESKYKQTAVLLLTIAVFCLSVFPTLGSVSLWDPDEGRYLVCAKNAIEHGHWLVPVYNGGPRVEKPPLMVWLVAASSILLNGGKVNEFTARLPSAVFALLTLVVLFLLVRWHTGDGAVAALSSFFLSTSLLFVKQARFAITDMVLLFFITSAIFAGAVAVERGSKAATIAAFFLCALGFMDKGPVALVIPAVVVLLFAASERKLSNIPWKVVPVGLAVFALAALWWPALVGKPYWHKFIYKSNIERLLHNPSWKTGPLFYVFNFPTHFLLASALTPAVAVALKRYRRANLSLFLIWFCVVFVLFSISDTKRSSYILPLYPAAAAVFAWAFERIGEDSRALRTSLALMMGAITLALLWFTVFALVRGAPPLYYTASVGAIFGVWTLFFAAKNRPKALALVLCALFSLAYTNLYQPAYDRLHHSPKRCVEKMKEIVKDAPLYVYGSLRSNELWYWGRTKIPRITDTTPVEEGSYFYTRERQVFLPGREKRVLCCSYQKHRLCLYRKY